MINTVVAGGSLSGQRPASACLLAVVSSSLVVGDLLVDDLQGFCPGAGLLDDLISVVLEQGESFGYPGRVARDEFGELGDVGQRHSSVAQVDQTSMRWTAPGL